MVWNENLKRDLPERWSSSKIVDILGGYPKTRSIVASNYLKNGKFPVIDQSTNFICGFTNELDSVLHVDDAIVFGDHTNVSKYVNGKK